LVTQHLEIERDAVSCLYEATEKKKIGSGLGL
jgi:hypothetical protein